MARVDGILGYLGLGSWWMETFTTDERDYIESVFQPLGSPRIAGRSRPVTSQQRRRHPPNFLARSSAGFVRVHSINASQDPLLPSSPKSSIARDLYWTVTLAIRRCCSGITAGETMIPPHLQPRSMHASDRLLFRPKLRRQCERSSTADYRFTKVLSNWQ